MTDFTIKSGDTRPSLEVQLLDEDKNPRDLQTAESVKFYMEEQSSNNVVVDAEGSVVNESEGIVVYEWQNGDTESTGRHIAEFEIHYTDSVETFPNDNYINMP